MNRNSHVLNFVLFKSFMVKSSSALRIRDIHHEEHPGEIQQSWTAKGSISQDR